MRGSTPRGLDPAQGALSNADAVFTEGSSGRGAVALLHGERDQRRLLLCGGEAVAIAVPIDRLEMCGHDCDARWCCCRTATGSPVDKVPTT